MRTLAARSVAACSTAWCTSCAGTSTVSLTLSSASSSTWVGICAALNQTCYRPGPWTSKPPSGPGGRTSSTAREPVDEATLRELVDLARFAPNHKLTQPWRFRAARPGDARRGSRSSAGEKEAMKLRRAPTLVLATARPSDDPRARRGGSARDGVRRLRGPARRDRARARVLLAHAGVLRRAGRPRRRRARRRRARRRARPPRPDRRASRRPRSGRRSTRSSRRCRRPSMRARGVEPPRAEAHRDLNPARLPVPPRPRWA